MKPFSQACENNKTPILTKIAPLFKTFQDILEIGSGTGQHAVFFAEQLLAVHWHTSDCPENHPGINLWINESGLNNIEAPINLNIQHDDWPQRKFDAVYTANTCHIMHWDAVIAMFEGVKDVVFNNGLFVIYGPFNYNDAYTSESNRRFDSWLKTNDPDSGIRNFEDIINLAKNNLFELMDDVAMPANNRLLIFKRD